MLANWQFLLVPLLLAWSASRWGSEWLRSGKHLLGRLAVRRTFSVMLIGCLAFTLSAGLSVLGQIPPPRIHDEFGNLLAADTFAHGRLSNRTHPLWVHFESPHIIHQPTYASKYPPGQGLLLAVGQVLVGLPIAGAWLGNALACAALCWMFQAWLPPRWALLGGLLAVFHPTMIMWSHSYWGGSLAVCGGALVLGSFRRLVVCPRAGDALWLGSGMAALALSRPFEGLVFSLSVLAILLSRLCRRQGPSRRVRLARMALPVGVVLACTAGALGYYHWRVTGHALRVPYQVHEEAYGVAQLFWWQAARPEPVYRHKELHDFHVGWELPSHAEQQTVQGLCASSISKLATLFHGYFPHLALQLPLLGLPLLRRDIWMRRLLFIGGVLAVTLLCETWVHPHYAAPAAGLIFVLVLESMRQLRLGRWRGLPVGRWVASASLLATLVLAIPFCVELINFKSSGWPVHRIRLLTGLRQTGERHLVIVRYRPEHSPHDEWVYNEADIDGAPVVWAREMGEAQDHQLMEYFQGRRVWLLEADAPVPKLVPYPECLPSLSEKPPASRSTGMRESTSRGSG
jgi:hypothetical protein